MNNKLILGLIWILIVILLLVCVRLEALGDDLKVNCANNYEKGTPCPCVSKKMTSGINSLNFSNINISLNG